MTDQLHNLLFGNLEVLFELFPILSKFPGESTDCSLLQKPLNLSSPTINVESEGACSAGFRFNGVYLTSLGRIAVENTESQIIQNGKGVPCVVKRIRYMKLVLPQVGLYGFDSRSG